MHTSSLITTGFVGSMTHLIYLHHIQYCLYFLMVILNIFAIFDFYKQSCSLQLKIVLIYFCCKSRDFQTDFTAILDDNQINLFLTLA